MTFKVLAIAAALATTPMASQALTIITNGGSYTVSSSSNQFVGPISTTAGSGGSFTVSFDAASVPLSFILDAEIAITSLVASTFTDLELSWLNGSNGNVISTIPIVGGVLNSLSTDLNAPITQLMQISWTNSLAGFGLTVIANPTPGSTVPLPVTALLLGTALAGLGAFGRKANAA